VNGYQLSLLAISYQLSAISYQVRTAGGLGVPGSSLIAEADN
jgi:hypothetical protein